MFKSIRTDMFIVTVFMVTIPLLACNAISYYIVSSNIETKMREDNLIFTIAVAHNIRSLMNEAYVITEELAANNDIRSFNPMSQAAVLRQSHTRHSQFDLLYVQNIDGLQTANSLGRPGGDRSGRWWYKEFMSIKAPFVSKSYYTITDDTAVISIFMPVYAADGLEGILGADLKPNAIQALIDRLVIGKGGYTYVLDSQGTVIAHPDTMQVDELYNYKTMTRTILPTDGQGVPLRDSSNNHIMYEFPISVPEKLSEVASLALKGESGTAEYKDLNGQDMICAYSAIDLPGHSKNWAVITVDNKTAAMTTATQIIIRNMVVAATALEGAIMIIYFLSRRVTQPILLMDKQVNQIAKGQLHKPLAGHFGHNEIGRLASSFEKMRAALAELHTEQEAMFLSTIRSLVIALESKDNYTHSHSIEVADIAAQIAQELKLPQREQFRIKFAALLHDIGKIGIPDHVLNKQDRLTVEEWNIMKEHPGIGGKIIGTIPNMDDIANIIKHHHSSWDGTGYPANIKGKDIPIGARIIAVADAFQAMTSDRPYRKALPFQYALDEIRRCAGSQFDGQVVEAFIRITDSVLRSHYPLEGS